MRNFCLLVSFLSFSISLSAQTADDFFNDTILQEIRLDIFPADWEKLKANFLDNTYYPSDMTWRFKGQDVAIPQIGIRSRGTGSRSSLKPGLRVDFDRYDSKQKFAGLKSFILRNNTQDASMMHEFIAMGLMRRMGLPAMREAFTKLYVNGAYLGLYTVVESPDKTFLNEHFGEDGGYLYQYDYNPGDKPWLFEYKGSNPALYVPKPFKPETHEDNPNSAAIEALVRTINQAPDASFTSAMAPYLNFNPFLTEIAAEAFLAEQDGILGDYGVNNFYLYQFVNTTRFQFIPWDKSNAFDAQDRSVWQNTNENVLMRRTLAVPSLKAMFVDALSRARSLAGGAGGWMEKEIRVYALTRDAAYLDTNKECDPGHTGELRPCTNAQFDAEVAFITVFARTRSDTVASQIAAVTGGQQSFTISDRGGSSFLSNSSGNNFGQGSTTIAAYGQTAHFLNEAPFNGGASLFGSLTFTSSVPVAVVAIRGFSNERSEFLITTLPVVDMPNPSPASVLPHFADGGGWTSQIVLVNPSDQSISGSVQFFSQGTLTAPAQPVTVSIGGQTNSSFAYTIAPRSSVRLRTAGVGTSIQVGSARVLTSDRLPEAFAIFSFKKDGFTVSEAGVPTISSGNAFRMYVETGTGGLQTGLAVVNLSSTPAIVNFELTTLAGTPTGLSGGMTIPSNGQTGLFLSEIPGFVSLPVPFQGVLRASTASSGGISMVGLRGRYNERGDFLVTTTPPVLENSSPTADELLFPHFAYGGGYTTQFILFSGYAGQTSAGMIRYFSQTGQPLDVTTQ